MHIIQLRSVFPDDLKYFAQWWRDGDLIALTSGNYTKLPDNQLERYFQVMLTQQGRVDRMIELNAETIGHVNAQERTDNWWELQIIIGQKEYWGKGHGPVAIQLLLNKLRDERIAKVYLEVRPENTRAIHAYGKCEFQTVRYEQYDNPNQPETIRMELKL